MAPRKTRGHDQPLSALPPGTKGRISAVGGEEVTRRQLFSMGIVEGVLVDVVRRTAMGGTILVSVGASQYALGREVAAGIRVTKA